ncbi:hypothetical protein F5Y18DRAFT_434184 [Xylariaceae sp. FL1019]|nr:hypothetical protein F5Y18DRAFT_434184 [Xylariaceae sp. FL1019]
MAPQRDNTPCTPIGNGWLRCDICFDEGIDTKFTERSRASHFAGTHPVSDDRLEAIMKQEATCPEPGCGHKVSCHGLIKHMYNKHGKKKMTAEEARACLSTASKLGMGPKKGKDQDDEDGNDNNTGGGSGIGGAANTIAAA